MLPVLMQNLTHDNQPNCENGIGQFFLSDLHLNFRLRENKNPNLPSTVYGSFMWEGVRYRVNTGYKVMAAHWDSKSQRADVSSAYSDLENRNNSILNEKLSKIYLGFSDFFLYFCRESSDRDAIPIKLRSIINPLKNYAMGKNNKHKLIHSQQSPTYVTHMLKEHVLSLNGTKESSKKTYIGHVNLLATFLQKKGLKDDVSTICKSETWVKFKSFLLNGERSQGVAARAFAMLRDWVEELKDKHHWEDFDLYILNMKGIECKANQRNYVIVSNDELDIILNLSDNELSPEAKSSKHLERIKRHRDYFCLQCMVGCRVSDLDKVLAIDGQTDIHGRPYIVNKDGEKWFSFIPKKTDNSPKMTRCIIPFSLDGRIEMLYERQKGSLPKEMSRTAQRNYNEDIKVLCKLAGMVQPMKKYDTKSINGGFKTSDTLRWKEVTSHDARHSMITNLVKKGFLPSYISHFTGHTDTQYIDHVYTNCTPEDNMELVSKMMSDMDDTLKELSSEQTTPFNSLPIDVDEARSVLCFLGEDYDEYCESDFETLLRMVAVKEHEILTKCETEGIQLDLQKIKEVFNDKASLKARKNALRALCKTVKEN